MGPVRLLFLHPSDEHYGADRVLLDIHTALPPHLLEQAEVWLPDDLPHGPHPLCEQLAARGASVRHAPLPILRRAYRSPAGVAALAGRCRQLRRLLRDRRPDAVYCTTSAALLGAPVARSAGVRRVLGHLQELWSPADARVLAPLAARCDGLLAISTAVRTAIPERLRPRTAVVHNATPWPTTAPRWRDDEGPLRHVAAGRWTPGKGLDVLLAAWELTEEEGELVLLGGPPPSGAAVDVPALVAAMRHPGSVSVVGDVADPGPHLDRADVVVMPSVTPEGFGLVAVEGFARGRPVVASAAGGLLDIVTDGHDGWLVPPGDPAALAHALSALDREQVRRAGHRARETFERRFTPELYADRWRAATAPLLSPV